MSLLLILMMYRLWQCLNWIWQPKHRRSVLLMATGCMVAWLFVRSPDWFPVSDQFASPDWVRPTIAREVVADPLADRIRQIRTGKVKIRVVDQAGKPIENAQIQLEQTAHAFEFGGAIASEMFGFGVNPIEKMRYFNLAKQLFNATVPENALKWYTTEPVRGRVSYTDADRILAWSEQQHFPMRGHNLFWAVEQWNSDWLKTLSSQELRNAVRNRAIEICRRYRGRIPEYDVLNEMLNGNFFQSRLGEGIVKEMFLWCHEVDPNATLYTNEYAILTGEQLQPYIQRVRSLLAEGVPVGAIGIQAHIRSPITRSQIQSSLDQLAELGLPLKITECSVIASTAEQEAQTLKDVYHVAFAHPAVTGIYLWGFWEGAIWQKDSALFRQNFTPEPAATAYTNLVYGDWWTRENGKSDRTGEWSTDAFFGSYRLTVRQGQQVRTQTFDLAADDRSPAIITVTF